MQGHERTVTSTAHEWVMQTPVDLKDLELAINWARRRAEEIHGPGAGDFDNAGTLVILDETTVAMRVAGFTTHELQEGSR